MNIKIPDRFMGQPILGAMERVLTNTPKPEPENTAPAQVTITANIAQPEKYILLPGRTHGSYSYPNLLVPMERSHYDKDWNETHQELASESAYMLTLRQFVDFLNVLKSGNVNDGRGNKIDRVKSNEILNDITQVRYPWRAEWIDARFIKQGRYLQIAYHTINPNGAIDETIEPLGECLRGDKTPGIDLNDWLANATVQGLPAKKVKKGSLCYWSPADGIVARFNADSDRVNLNCNRNPSNTNSSLGITLTLGRYS